MMLPEARLPAGTLVGHKHLPNSPVMQVLNDRCNCVDVFWFDRNQAPHVREFYRADLVLVEVSNATR